MQRWRRTTSPALTRYGHQFAHRRNLPARGQEPAYHAPLLARDTGKSVSRLVSLSHTHVLATLPVIFLRCRVFSFTLQRERVKAVVSIASFLAIVLDIGSWWLAKFVPALAPLVVGGVWLALSFLVLIVLSLYDFWLRKRAAANRPPADRSTVAVQA